MDLVRERWKSKAEVISLIRGGQLLQVDRVALTIAQVRKWNPPPNPAKMTDPRAKKYVEAYGSESWELDALEPSIMAGMVRENVMSLVDKTAWDRTKKQERAYIKQLGLLAKHTNEAVTHVTGIEEKRGE